MQIRKMHFHLPLFVLTLFRTSQKPPQASVKRLLLIKEFLFEIWRFTRITRFSCNISKSASKQVDGNPAFVRYIFAINMLHPRLSSSAVT